MISDDLKKNVSETINIVSSEATIQVLPFEILREVFLAGWREADFEFREQFIRLVSWTCQWWRNVALETPELWSSISVKLSKPQCCAVVTEHLRRSREWPLHFQIDSGGIFWNSLPFDVESSRVAEMMELFVPHIRRWRVVELTFSHPSTIQIAFAYMRGEASLLEKMSLQYKLFHPFPIDPAFPLDFTAPEISSVTLTGITFPRPWSPLLLRSLSGLRELTVIQHFDSDGENMAMFVKTLSFLPNLARLNMSYFFSKQGLSQPARILPRLTYVSFSNVYPNDVNNFLVHVIAPNLTRMCMTGLKGYPLDRFVQFEDFPENFPQLHHLVLNPTQVHRELVPEILRAPFARRLTLQFPASDPSSSSSRAGYDFEDENDCVPNDVLVDLAKPVSGDGEWLCPRLQCLEILGENVDPETLQLLVSARLQASRSNSPLAPNAIQSLRVSVSQFGAWTVGNRQYFADHIPNFVFEV